MRKYLSLAISFAFVLLSAIHISAQETTSAAQNAENLRAQLRDVQMRQGEIQLRLNELDFELRPENIQRFFAGVGSTRPEELREQRRRQLQLEKDTLTTQLQSLNESKLRLETAITRADALTYQQSAFGSTSLMLTRIWTGHRGLVLTGAIMFVGLVGLFAFALIVRGRRSRGR